MGIKKKKEWSSGFPAVGKLGNYSLVLWRHKEDSNTCNPTTYKGQVLASAVSREDKKWGWRGNWALAVCWEHGPRWKTKANHFLLCRKRMVLVQLRAEDKRWKEAKQRRRRVHKVHASTALVKPSSERYWQRWPTFQKRVPDKKKGNSVKPFQGNRSSPSNIYLYCPLALIKNNLKGKLFLIQQQLILFSWA